MSCINLLIQLSVRKRKSVFLKMSDYCSNICLSSCKDQNAFPSHPSPVVYLNQKSKGVCSTFSFNLVFPSTLCTISLTSINLRLPLHPFFTVAEIRRHHSCLLQPGKLSSPHSPIHLQPLEGEGLSSSGQSCVFLLLPHEPLS